jgi:hypothetical protein
MRRAPYIVVEADEQRPLTVIQVRVYADRIVSTELGGPCSVHQTPSEAAAEIERRCARARES